MFQFNENEKPKKPSAYQRVLTYLHFKKKISPKQAELQYSPPLSSINSHPIPKSPATRIEPMPTVERPASPDPYTQEDVQLKRVNASDNLAESIKYTTMPPLHTPSP